MFRFLAPLAVFVAYAFAPLQAQEVISAKSGLIHFVSGKVYLQDPSGAPAAPPVVNAAQGQFPVIPRGGILSTEEGLAEVLLGPGVFLRMTNRSQFQLLNDSLTDTRLRLEDGVFLLEVAEFNKENAIHLEMAGTQMEIRDDGLYRFDADPAVVHVYDGKVRLFVDDERVEVKKGKFLPLDGRTTKVEKFDRKATDSFYAWNEMRALRIARANMVTARQMATSGRLSLPSSRWFFNPYFGMWTFLPSRGIFSSPFGFQYWSPYAVYYTFIQPPQRTADPWANGPSYRTIGPTPRGTSGTINSAGSTMGAPRSTGSAPIPRSSGSSGGRSR